MVVMSPTRRPSPWLGRVGVHDSLSGPAQSSLALRPVALRLDSSNLCPEASRLAVARRTRSVATEAYHQFLGQDFHLLDDDAFHGAPNHLTAIKSGL
jgi:hypothetical protein